MNDRKEVSKHMKQDATLALISQDSSSVTFQATFEGKGSLNPYDLWVQCEGLDGSGTVVSETEGGLRWNEQSPVPDGAICQITLSKPANAASFKAYVWLFPDNTTPVSNTVSF